MKTNTQHRKSCLAQFGEFSVAAELSRRGYLASVTYGNQKRTDVLALSGDGRYAVIEVKTTDKNRFPTGLTKERLTEVVDNQFWVFVATTPNADLPQTQYFVLTDKEAKQLQAEHNRVYNERYRARHNMDYDKEGVPGISLLSLKGHGDQWSKIGNFLSAR